MKAYSNIFECANVVMNNTKTARKEWRMKYNTLTRLLHDTQTKDAWKVTEPIYEAIGLPLTRKVSRSDAEAKFHIWYTDKRGNKFPAYVSRVADKDKDGNVIKDKDGNAVYHYETKPVKDGTWTLDRLAKVLACSNNALETKEAKK